MASRIIDFSFFTFSFLEMKGDYIKSEATLGNIEIIAEETGNNWDGLSQVHQLYASRIGKVYGEDEVDATSRIRFLFESQNSLRHALQNIHEDDNQETIYDEDGTEMETYRSNHDGNDENQKEDENSDENKNETDENNEEDKDKETNEDEEQNNENTEQSTDDSNEHEKDETKC